MFIVLTHSATSKRPNFSCLRVRLLSKCEIRIGKTVNQRCKHLHKKIGTQIVDCKHQM